MASSFVKFSWMTSLLFVSFLGANEKEHNCENNLPPEIQKIMQQPKYEHSIWGLYVKDLKTGHVIYDLNSNLLFSPASTTKLFSVAALLHTFGNNYRFKTPVYATAEIKNGLLEGNLILVGQGDLTLGGRQSSPDTISFTKLDHIIANEVPGALLTPEDPLKGVNELAKQVYAKGLKELNGNVIIDDSLFKSTETRGSILSPININENLIDIILNPSKIGENANLTWRPMVQGYSIENQVKTVDKGQPVNIEIKSDALGKNIIVKGTLPLGHENLLRTFSIKDPKDFARAAFIQALQNQGIKLNLSSDIKTSIPSLQQYSSMQPIALWTSPPLSEYAKLILKVSHNLGANLIPLLLASHQGKKTYDEGMHLLGDYVINEIKLSPNEFVFADAAGGNENRLTPRGEVQLLEYLHTLSPKQFQQFFDALPILGVDGSLADYAKNTPAVGKVRAKTGTGMSTNLATNNFFLITQALAGYVEGKNGHLLAYMLAVNNEETPTINDVLAIFEDESQISSMIYNFSQ